jgi:anti-anti-sigma factor
MSSESPQTQNLIVSNVNGVCVVGFASHYLQTEAVIAKVGAELQALAKEHEHGRMVLSFDGVRFVSSSMLAEVVRLHKAITKGKGKLRVCGLAPTIRDVLRASQLDKLLDVHENETTALAGF